MKKVQINSWGTSVAKKKKISTCIEIAKEKALKKPKIAKTNVAYVADISTTWKRTFAQVSSKKLKLLQKGEFRWKSLKLTEIS